MTISLLTELSFRLLPYWRQNLVSIHINASVDFNGLLYEAKFIWAFHAFKTFFHMDWFAMPEKHNISALQMCSESILSRDFVAFCL